MPRKKAIDPIDLILTFIETATTPTVEIVIGLLRREVRKRQAELAEPVAPAKPIVRRRRIKPSPAAAVLDAALPEVVHIPATAVPKRRRRRMRADSPAPIGEATPIVPLQAEVGEDETYTGN